MNILTRKRVVGLTACVVILAGAVSPIAVQASAENDCSGQPPAMYQRHFDPDKIAQRIADTYGVNKEDVLKYNNEGVSFKDVFKASFLAKASGKSLKEVMEVKTYDNTWKDAAQSLGVTKEQMKATRNDIAATQLENKLQISKQTSLDLMQQGYRTRDIAVANALSNNTGKPIIDVLAMKKINNTWLDVASTLGVDDNTFQQDMKDLKTVFHHKGFQGQHQWIMM
jgi:hypothetical protein